jgi:hypothetical protein
MIEFYYTVKMTMRKRKHGVREKKVITEGKVHRM